MFERSSTSGRNQQWSRRTFLLGAGGVALSTAGISVLAACGPGAASVTNTPAAAAPTTATQPTAATTPTAVPKAAGATAAPAATGTIAAAPTGTLRVAGADFGGESFDPIVVGSQWGSALYDLLLVFDEQGNVKGNVAQSYSLSDDGLTWTFNIRKGIKFHNGDPLTAEDVVFSLQRFGSKESTNPWSPYILKNNESITAPDDSTVIYKAQKPEWPLKVTHDRPKLTCSRRRGRGAHLR